MWIIKFLSGPKAGQEHFLPSGLYVLGREKGCKLQITAKGISKKHAQIIVNDQGVHIEDLKSRNGTFLNGRQIQNSKLEEGNRIALGEVIFELRKKKIIQPHPYFSPYPQQVQVQQPHNEGVTTSKIPTTKQALDEFKSGFKNYIHQVVLPGIYKLAEFMEFRVLIGCFVVGFVFLVVTFSSVPLIQILKSSVEQESRNHAESIATTVSKLNRKYLSEGLHSAITLNYALRRPGVKEAYIINTLNGQIIAPADKAHTYPKNAFVHKARKLDQVSVEKINSSSIAAVVPIRFFNKSSGEQSAIAYSVVIYDMGALAVGGSKVASLMIQNLFIACIFGLLLFFLLINLIEFPVRSINSQFVQALRDDEAPQISINYQSTMLKDLCSNINSALNQLSLNRSTKEENKAQNPEAIELSRQSEMDNLVEIIGFPALAVQLSDNTIATLNSNFKDQIGLEDILHQSVQDISKSDLKEHLTNLLEQGNSQLGEISFGEINIQGSELQTTCQFIMGAQGPAYAIVTFVPNQEEDVA